MLLTSKASISAMYVSLPATSSAFGAYLHRRLAWIQATRTPMVLIIARCPQHRPATRRMLLSRRYGAAKG